MMRPIDADTLKVLLIETLEQIARKPNMDSQEIHIIAATHVLCAILGGVGGRGWNYCPNCGAKMEDEQ